MTAVGNLFPYVKTGPGKEFNLNNVYITRSVITHFFLWTAL